MRDNPRPFEIYRHFKGKLYQILTLAIDSETGRQMVVYQALYDDFKVYVRSLDMFMGRVDKEKYTEAVCDMRFERIDSPSEPDKAESAMAETARNEIVLDGAVADETALTEHPDIDPLVFEFLEASRVEERINILSSLHHRITDDMINTMAVVMDVEVNEGPLEERYQQLKNCLLTKQKFEKVRY